MTLGARWGDYVQADKMLEGFADGTAKKETLNRFQQMELIRRLQVRIQDEGLASRSDENLRTGSQFRENNGARPEVTTTASGLQYEVVEQGDGPKPGPGSRVRVNYRGTLVDGTVFDSTSDGAPATFLVNRVIPGWTEALQLMNVGSKYRIVVPPELGYGDRPNGPGGPNSTLIFDVELLEIVE